MPSASNNAESSAIDGGSPRVSRRTACATAAGASALGMLTTGVASAADPRARCAAPQFLKPFEVAGKWTVPLPIPTALPTGTTAPGFNASPTELSNWQGQHPAYVMQPRGWIRVADIQQQLQQPPEDRAIGRLFTDSAGSAEMPLDPPVRHLLPDSAEARTPLGATIEDRRDLAIAPEFWQVEGGFDPAHFWAQHEFIPFYEMVVGEFDAEIVKGLKTRVWGYNRQVPGPSFVEHVNRPMVVRYINELPTEISVHLHGGHTPSHSDGHPAFLVCGGKHADGTLSLSYRDYFYSNGVPKKPSADPLQPGNWDFSESQSTMWYHDHANDITAHNALMGLAGFQIIRDAWEDFLIRHHILPEGDAAVPENNHDIPLVLADRCLCRPSAEDPKTARIHFDPFDHNGYLGNIPVCNGKAWPVLKVKAHKYRLRFLNGSLARVFLLSLWDAGDIDSLSEEQVQNLFIKQSSDPIGTRYAEEILPLQSRSSQGPGGRTVARPWSRIGKDSWLQSHPVWDDQLMLAMANRADVIVDFKALLNGRKKATFFLVNLCDQRNGRGPGHGDNGLADQDGAGIPLPRGSRVNIPALDQQQRQEAFPDGEGDSEKFDMLKLLRIDIEDDGSADPCVFSHGLEALATLLSQPAVQAEIEQDERLKSNAPRDTAGHLLPVLREHDDLMKHLSWQEISQLPVRRFDFERGRGAWRVSGRFFDEERADATPVLGGLEVWHLVNRSGGWWHPIHMHLESHQQIYVDFNGEVMSRIDKLGNRHERAEYDMETRLPHDCFKHDTAVLGPNTEVMILMRFRTFRGPFVFHCHNLNHEDMRMMATLDPRMQSLGENPVSDDDVNAPVVALPKPLIPDELAHLQRQQKQLPVPARVPVQQFFGGECHD
jgi:FtsP/CotA-like multicopper oxidase with cupredoxin domain